MSKSGDDTNHLQAQLIELNTNWDKVCKLSLSKQARLEDALKIAEDFHKKSHMMLEWLSDGEMKLRFAGPIPDTEADLIKQIEEHKVSFIKTHTFL